MTRPRPHPGDLAAYAVLLLVGLALVILASPRIATAMDGDVALPLAGLVKIPLRAGPIAIRYVEGGCR